MNTKELYPFKFNPIYKERIWGGRKLQHFLDKNLPEAGLYGESWEIADLPSDQSIISNGEYKGEELGGVISAFAKAILGASVLSQFGSQFPLLIKYIDAAKDLSVQLHPNDEIAEKEHSSKGKTEMWYIISADEGATITAGFNQDVDAANFSKSIEEGTVENLLQLIPVKAGDAFYIKAGLIHAIGDGIVLAEIQQASDITYRVYDYKRKEQDGSYRDLHIEPAKKAIVYKNPDDIILHHNKSKLGSQILKHSEYFKTDIVRLQNTAHFIERKDTFTVIMVVDGELTLAYDKGEEKLKIGETALIPASCPSVRILSSDVKFLEVYL